MQGLSQGGFMPGQSGTNGSSRDNKQALRPVTIRQVVQAVEPSPEGTTYIDNSPADRIVLVGQIREITDRTSNIVYRIEDGTGSLEVRKWESGQGSQGGDGFEDNAPSAVSPFSIGQYVSVVGGLRVFNNKRQVNALHMVPVTDFNQVIYHQLSALDTHLDHTEGKAAKTQPGSESLFVDGTSQHSLRDRILQLLGGQELDVQYISHQLHADEYEVRRELTALEDRGSVYLNDQEGTYSRV